MLESPLPLLIPSGKGAKRRKKSEPTQPEAIGIGCRGATDSSKSIYNPIFLPFSNTDCVAVPLAHGASNSALSPDKHITRFLFGTIKFNQTNLMAATGGLFLCPPFYPEDALSVPSPKMDDVEATKNVTNLIPIPFALRCAKMDCKFNTHYLIHTHRRWSYVEGKVTAASINETFPKALSTVMACVRCCAHRSLPDN